MIKTALLITFFILHLVMVIKTNRSRRILDGSFATIPKGYLVYFVKAPISKQKYNAWLCGGAIVSQTMILTSAACVEDVEHMYAISGLSEYVDAEHIKTHSCASKVMKKVVMTCVPRAYDLQYEHVGMWSNVDIALAKVESPFDYFRKPDECEYTPRPIVMNLIPKYQSAGIDAQVYGWGHKHSWRSPGDDTDMNEKHLLFSPLVVQPKTLCYKAYRGYNLTNIISKYMLCVNSIGNVNLFGVLERRVVPISDGCITEHEKDSGAVGELCGTSYNKGRRNNKDEEEMYTFRRNGICQNDHGGPLISYIGTWEFVIGVASVFRVSNLSTCVGPFLFTSTLCSSAFLDCVLTEEKGEKGYRSAKSVCNKSPIERGFDIKKKIISWKNHPDGPAKNEQKPRKKSKSKVKKSKETS